MKFECPMPVKSLVLAVVSLSLVACNAQQQDCESVTDQSNHEVSTVEASIPENVEGLTATIIKAGRDHAVATGDEPSMHYTGWLFDENAEGGRGTQFDSSRGRGVFSFPLGGGRVIKGWDVGVAGMQIGEVRELKIAPEMGYGERGAQGVIPPNATLIFEVELVSFKRCKTFD